MLYQYRPWLVAALLQMSAVPALAQEKVAPPAEAPRPAPAAQPAPAPAATPAPAPAAVPAPADNAVAATVNGQPIPEKAVRRALERGVPPDRWAQARQEILNYL